MSDVDDGPLPQGDPNDTQLPGENREDDPTPPDETASHSGSQETDAEAHGAPGAGESGPEGDAQAGSGDVPGAGG